MLETGTFVTKVGHVGCTLDCHEGGFSVVSVPPASVDIMGGKTTESSEGTC